MKAQQLHDLRNDTAFCNGNELHDFFRSQVGDPSPSGKVEIDDAAAQSFVAGCMAEMANNSPNEAAKVQAELDGKGI